MKKLKANLMEILLEKKLTVSCAESLTGGLLASSFVDISGASKFFAGGVITYMLRTKNSELSIPEHILGVDAVNEDTAAYMAREAAKKFQTDIGISTTGIAEKYDDRNPCAYMCIWDNKNSKAFNFYIEFPEHFSRQKVREQVVENLLENLFSLFTFKII